jgi:hypothetical protein
VTWKLALPEMTAYDVVVIQLRTSIITFLLACGCGSNTRDTLHNDKIPILTSVIARSALIELIRSPEAGELESFPLDQFLEVEVHDDSESSSWGPFNLNLKAREYTISRSYGDPPRVCHSEYQGQFVWQDGHWIAKPPRCVSRGLGEK